jgi:hypothetical protein
LIPADKYFAAGSRVIPKSGNKGEKNLQSVILMDTHQYRRTEGGSNATNSFGRYGYRRDCIRYRGAYPIPETGHRSAQSQRERYSLEFLLILIILAKLAGENKPKGIKVGITSGS